MDYVKSSQEIPEMNTHWISESGIIDVFFLMGPKPSDIFSQYASLTGYPIMPPVSSQKYFQLHPACGSWFQGDLQKRKKKGKQGLILLFCKTSFQLKTVPTLQKYLGDPNKPILLKKKGFREVLETLSARQCNC